MEIDGVDCPLTDKKKYNSMECLMISMDCANWSEETKWKQYDSDTASVEFNVTELATDLSVAIGVSDNLTESLKGSASKHRVSDGKGDELRVSDGLKDELKSIEEKVDTLQVSDGKGDELKTTGKGEDAIGIVDQNVQAHSDPVDATDDIFKEDDVDPVEFERLLQEKKENKLYSIFRRRHLNLLTPGMNNSPVAGEKRKISPSAETPVSRQPRLSRGCKIEGDSRRRLMFNVGDEGEGRVRSRLNMVSGGTSYRPSIIPRRRTKSFKGSPGPDQKKITDMLKKKALDLDASGGQ